MQSDTFATRLRALMAARGIPTQAEFRRLLSAKLGREVGKQTVSAWFVGEKGCSGADIPAIASVLGLRRGSKAEGDLYRLSAQVPETQRERRAAAEASPAV